MQIDSILDAILLQANAETGSLMLPDSQAGFLKIVAARGFPMETVEQVKKLKLAPGEGIAGHVYQTGKPYYLRDSKNDALFVDPDAPSGAPSQFLSLPIENPQGKTIGVLNIHFPTEKLLSSSELRELHEMASSLVASQMPLREPALSC